MAELPLTDRDQQWPVERSVRVYGGQGPFGVRQDWVRPDGAPESFGRLVVEHPGAVIVLAVDDADQVLVLEQYRHPVGRRLVELPAGLLDVAGEDPQLAAERELLEEAGYRAQRWDHLLSVYPSPGLSREMHHFYLARDLVEVPDRGGFVLAHEEADMTQAWVARTELLDGVRRGRLQDGPLAVALWAFAAHAVED